MKLVMIAGRISARRCEHYTRLWTDGWRCSLWPS